MESKDIEAYYKQIGEDSAYTFKGLYKTHDNLRMENLILVIIAFALSVLSIVQIELIKSFVNIMAAISIIVTAIIMQRSTEYQKIGSYAKLANDYKTLYDKAYKGYLTKNYDNFDLIENETILLRSKTIELPISRRAYKKTKKVISKEMNLNWIYE